MNPESEARLLISEIRLFKDKLEELGAELPADVLELELSSEAVSLADLRKLKRDLERMIRTIGGARGA